MPRRTSSRVGTGMTTLSMIDRCRTGDDILRHNPPRAQRKACIAGLQRAGRATSRALVEAALDRIADPVGEGKRAFVKVYGDNARAAADAHDKLRAAGYVASPLAGI